MPDALSLTAMATAAFLCAWGAHRDLGLPAWLTLLGFAAIVAATHLAVGAAFAPVAALTFTCLLIAETDRRHHLIPDAFSLAALALSVVMPFGDDIIVRIIGALILGATFLVIRQSVSALHNTDALGLGDVKLAAAMGATLGPVYGFAAVAVAGVATLSVIAIRARNGAVTVGAPFGIGLASATAAVAIMRALAP